MGLFDGYFDPQQFRDGGGLLGRLLSLQQQQGQYQPAQGFDQALSDGTPSEQNLKSRYQALRSILGDHRAMIATINPELGRTLIAQALASQQKSGSTDDARLTGCDPPVVSDVSSDPIWQGSQYAQAATPGPRKPKANFRLEH